MLVEDRRDTKSPEVEEQITHHLDYTIYQRIFPVISTLYTKHNCKCKVNKAIKYFYTKM